MRVVGGAVLLGALTGLLLNLPLLLVVVAIAVVVAVFLGARSENRTTQPDNLMARPTPYGLFAGFAVLFWLFDVFGFIFGVIIALVLVVAFFLVGGDLG